MLGDKFTVVTLMRNEAPYILEWVAHYKALGFDYIVVCTNDCGDTTVPLLKRLEEMGLVYHHNTIIRGKQLQGPAIRQGMNLNEEVKASRWKFICDADEFLNIHIGDGTVQDLVEASGDGFDALCVPWRCYIPAGAISIVDEPVTEQFRLGEVTDNPRLNPKPGKFMKSLVCPSERIMRMGIHFPKFKEMEHPSPMAVLPGGTPYVVNGKHTGEKAEFSIAQVNHYPLRSLDAFLVKRARGRACHRSQVVGVKYWERFDLPAIPDKSIDRYRERRNAYLDIFREDRILRRMHKRALHWHWRKAAAIKMDPDNDALVSALLEKVKAWQGLAQEPLPRKIHIA